MEKFEKISGIAAALPLINVDTDMIIPKQFLKTIKRSGLGKNLFYEMRYDMNGKPINDFVLNRTPFDKAKILLAYDNFGCGSSREHAPWALLDFGIRCVIAPSFADIFYNNCFKNSVLPVILPQETIDILMKQTYMGANAAFSIDLIDQKVIDTEGNPYPFNIEESKKHSLVNGLDDIAQSLQHESKITFFEESYGKQFTWL